MSSITVLLCDDHTLLREGIKALLNATDDIEVIGEASDGSDALTKIGKLKPGVVVMDIAMPRLSGLEATRMIKQRYPETGIVILTMHENEEYLLQILAAGAQGYVLKRAAVSELEGAIRAVAGGDNYFSPPMAKALVGDYLRRVEVGDQVDPFDNLSSREREILRLIAEGDTNKTIAEKLFISIKTVQTHRMHIMEKLDIHDIAGLVRYAIRKGLVEAS